MSEPKFINGLRVFKPRENSPDFVKGNLLINKIELLNWLAEQPDEQIRSDILVSKEKGLWYLKVNDWKPSDAKSVSHSDMGGVESYGDFQTEDIPF